MRERDKEACEKQPERKISVYSLQFNFVFCLFNSTANFLKQLFSFVSTQDWMADVSSDGYHNSPITVAERDNFDMNK